MQSQIIEQLKKMGKVTEEDVRNAMREIPNEFELELIKTIWDSYCDEVFDNLEYTEIINVWVSHFLPILREESFKCMEKVRELDKTTFDSQPLPFQPPPKTHL